ncbi:autoinducer binding domain-containing protein [Alisedimentitalea sp. MJ-SS2]|uniref:helix-turn-helix transcriptional regulator n=1 Tax=Aliisedimentitalea sp. MJ-SS2 TaxID=3049795 RepID=UPI00290F671A|nr:autoinducer binding domain-containing protein [Alisedimentitalea sp. MJ-SS2]MDU8928964.1 autoinducer binding domain-containing protein [Alisedimentitalea sp. MJ-SS2]
MTGTNTPDAKVALLDVARIARAGTLQEAWQFFCDAMARWGFDQVNYGVTRFRVGDNIGSQDDILYLTTLPHDVAQEYFDTGFFAKTAIFRWLGEHVGSVSWGWAHDEMAAGRLSPQEEEAQRQTEAWGGWIGYSISFPESSKREKGVLGLHARAGTSQADVDALWARDGEMIEAVCLAANLKLSQMPVPGAKLTERQREILEWIADGKSLQDVCVLTDLSLSAVDKHLRKLRDNLDVETTAQAVAKVTFLNQLFQRSEPHKP